MSPSQRDDHRHRCSNAINTSDGHGSAVQFDEFLNQGKAAEALVAYRTATAKPHTLPWQQAIAYDRLGRLYAAQG